MDAFDRHGEFTDWLRNQGFAASRPLFRMCRAGHDGDRLAGAPEKNGGCCERAIRDRSSVEQDSPHMTNLPAEIRGEAQLEDVLSQPSPADVECVSRLRGDILIVGAAGKMGPSLARRAHRALGRAGSRSRVLAASRFSMAAVRESLEADGIETVACDLLDPVQIAALPRAENVLFLAGRKFGTLDRTDVTWATNTLVPARVAEHFAQSRMVVFSTGNVYPLVPAGGPGRREDDRAVSRSASTRSRASGASVSSSSYRASASCARSSSASITPSTCATARWSTSRAKCLPASPWT